SMFRTFRSIALPAAAPAAAMLFLFWFVMQWTMFFWPSIVRNSENPTLPLVVQSLQGTYFTDYSLVMAGVFLVTFPLLVIFVIVGKQLVAGIMSGAVKGCNPLQLPIFVRISLCRPLPGHTESPCRSHRPSPYRP